MYRSTLDAYHANFRLSRFAPQPLGHKRRPPVSKRAPASRKAWCPPQAATKWRTKIQKSWDAFHDSALYLTRHGRNLS